MGSSKEPVSWVYSGDLPLSYLVLNKIITRMILSEERMRENKSEILEKLLESMCRCKITKKRNELEKEIKEMLSGEKEKDLTKLREYNNLTKQLKGSQRQIRVFNTD